MVRFGKGRVGHLPTPITLEHSPEATCWLCGGPLRLRVRLGTNFWKHVQEGKTVIRDERRNRKED